MTANGAGLCMGIIHASTSASRVNYITVMLVPLLAQFAKSTTYFPHTCRKWLDKTSMR